MRGLDFYNVENRPWTGPRLDYGAIVGHTTTSASKIWIRNRYEGLYHFILTTDVLSETEINIGKTTADEIIDKLNHKIVYHEAYSFINRTDRSHVFHARSLDAGTRYFYYMFSDDVEFENRMVLGYETVYSFKTIASENSQLTFGLYSCHDPFKKESDADPWKRFFEILEEKSVDFIIGGGDQVYVDSSKTDIWKWLKKRKKDLWDLPYDELRQIMISWYRDVYRGYWGSPYIKKVHRSFPHYMIWDDHEIMDGWGSRTRAELSNELDTWNEWENTKKNLKLADLMFEAAKIVYLQYQHCHNPPTSKDVYDFTLNQKHAEFYFLDMRGQREFDLKQLEKRDGQGSKDRVLGKEQLKRFSTWAKGISANTKVIYIVSPVPVVHWTGFAVNAGDVFGSKDDFRDEWDHETNHLERNKILKTLFSVSHDLGIPVLFLSGDVHMSAVFRLSNIKYRNSKVFQVTSSPISRPPAPSITDIILGYKGRLETLNHSDAKRIRDGNDYYYERLTKFNSRSFCVIDSEIENTNLSLHVEFYGESPDEYAIKRKRLKLI